MRTTRLPGELILPLRHALCCMALLALLAALPAAAQAPRSPIIIGGEVHKFFGCAPVRTAGR